MGGRGKEDIREERELANLKPNTQILITLLFVSSVHLKYYNLLECSSSLYNTCVLWLGKRCRTKVVGHVITSDNECDLCVFKEYTHIFLFLNRILLEGHKSLKGLLLGSTG